MKCQKIANGNSDSNCSNYTGQVLIKKVEWGPLGY